MVSVKQNEVIGSSGVSWNDSSIGSVPKKIALVRSQIKAKYCYIRFYLRTHGTSSWNGYYGTDSWNGLIERVHVRAHRMGSCTGSWNGLMCMLMSIEKHVLSLSR